VYLLQNRGAAAVFHRGWDRAGAQGNLAVSLAAHKDKKRQQCQKFEPDQPGNEFHVAPEKEVAFSYPQHFEGLSVLEGDLSGLIPVEQELVKSLLRRPAFL